MAQTQLFASVIGAVLLLLSFAAHTEDTPPTLLPGQQLFADPEEEAEPEVGGSEPLPTSELVDAPGNKLVPPQLVHHVQPTYPEALRRSGHNGFVHLRVRIDRVGRPVEVQTVLSAHPLLEKAAVAAILQWRYSPATMNGEAIELWFVQPLSFALIGSPRNSYHPYRIAKAGSEKTFTAASVKVAVGAVYPYGLLEREITGSADAELIVGKNGSVLEARVTKASHPEFGMATKAMYEAWVFEPAKRDGNPVASAIKAFQRFSRFSDNLNIERTTFDLLKKKESSRPQTFKLDELDAMPKALYRPLPVYPRKLKADGVKDTVLIEFYVDETGNVLLPNPMQFENADLAWSAATALARWQFSPPTREGKPVIAKLRMPFAFR
jgi:TonB family protein